MARPGLPQLDNAVWRPLTRDDIEAMSRLQTAVNAVDRTYLLTPQELEEDFERHGEHAETDSIGAFTPDGEMLALGWAQTLEGARTERRSIIWFLVHPDVRGSVEDHLIRWIEAAAINRLRTFDDEIPQGIYRYGVYEWLTEEQSLFERLGYERARYFTENLRDLSQPIDDVPLAEEFTARPWSAESAGDALIVHNAAFADHWGSQPFTSDDWVSYHSGAFFLPQTSWVVYDGDDPVAYVACGQYPHDWEDRGRTEGWIEGIGTLRSHRGRGIASALITMVMEAFRGDGLEYACLGVDSESPTGANRIYERLGFVPEKRNITYRKLVD